MLRVVLDTNVIISAIIRDGKPRKLFKMGIDNNYQILMSNQMLDELSEVLHRSKFKMTEEEITRVISALKHAGKQVNVRSNFTAIRDPDDNIVINTAYDGKADYIVSGDPDLTDFKSFQGIKIVSVSEMLKVLQ